MYQFRISFNYLGNPQTYSLNGAVPTREELDWVKMLGRFLDGRAEVSNVKVEIERDMESIDFTT